MKTSIKKMKLSDLIPTENNPRQIKKDDFERLKESIKSFPKMLDIREIVVDENNRILGGHQRAKALLANGEKEVNVKVVEGLSEEEKREFVIRDNVQNGEWDFDVLANEWDDLPLDDWGIDLPIADIEEEIVEDEAPEPPAEPKSKLGEIYQLGEHRLMCGDATDAEQMAQLMGGGLADLYLTDPPYNVDYTDGHETERKIMNDHFDSDEQCGEELWLPAFENARANCKDCCSVYCFMPQGGTHMMMMMMMAKAGWNVKHELIWKKQSIVLNRADYNYQHEPFMYGWNKTHKFYGKGEFKNTSVWEIDRPTKSKEHPTMKPIKLLTEILMNATQKGDSVLDNFGGSGSTLIACEQTGRKCYMMELDPHYVDVIIERWENLTGKKAKLSKEK